MANMLKDVWEQAVSRLAVAAYPASARRDAELLLMHVTGRTRAALLTHPEQPLPPAQLEALYQAVERRAQSEPIQYITGTQEFYGLSFRVTPDVLIPRPETEHLVETAIELAQGLASEVKILDIGTGSGVIAVTLAHSLPNARVVATDISPAALAIARKNAQQHGVADRIAFVCADLFPKGEQMYDLICSNPPYIATSDVLEPQVVVFEPHAALFAGATGLEVYQRLVPRAAAALMPGGSLLLEIGYGQSAAVEALLLASQLQQVRFIADLQGITRVAVAVAQKA